MWPKGKSIIGGLRFLSEQFHATKSTLKPFTEAVETFHCSVRRLSVDGTACVPTCNICDCDLPWITEAHNHLLALGKLYTGDMTKCLPEFIPKPEDELILKPMASLIRASGPFLFSPSVRSDV